ncbi:uncharacterized protein LOC131251240 isoform X2 [Magnolia sinica]|uniref:uncharacterized protein LOC131251240 isoform X2 n=1 Tax=Magnolia sinica TaxID=86752 RepID=UPI00265A0DD4|nr:uncharacterized protein LOC131251240 isoform X2 [Magnolia sinica]
MENSGALLCQISALKDMLDQVNEEIEANIERTREIESEMVKCSEIDKGLLTKESEFTKMISMQEFEINGLIQVAAVASTSLELMKKDMSCLRMNLEEILKRKNEYREKFIVLCGNFQRDIVKGETEELWALLLDKEVLENEKFILNMKINALRNSTSAFVEEILEELHNSNSAMHSPILPAMVCRHFCNKRDIKRWTTEAGEES